MGLVEPDVDIYLGGAYGWLPVQAAVPDGGQADVRQAVATSGGGIAITRGRSAAGTVAAPGSASLTIDNRSGDYTSRNPRSPYYGLIGRNTPIRIAVPITRDDFDRTVASGWGTATGGQAWSILGGSASDFAVSGGVATHSHGTINTTRRTTLALSVVDVEQVTDISVAAVATGAAIVTGHIARSTGNDFYWLRAEFNVGGTVTLKISRVVASVVTDLAELAPVPGLTYTGGQALRVRSSVVDGRLAIRVWPADDPEPAAWTLTATDTVLTGPGQVGQRTWRVSGNSNTSPVVISHRNYRAVDRRATMEVPGWPPRWDVTGRDWWTPIAAVGVLDRLSGVSRPIRSALRRAIPQLAPVAYWPLEDPAGSTQAAADESTSAEPMRLFGYPRLEIPGSGGLPQPAAGLPVFGSGELTGSAPVIDLSQGGTLWAPVPQTTATGWQIEFVMRCPRGQTTNQVPLRWTTNDIFTDHPESEGVMLWDFEIDDTGWTVYYGQVGGAGSLWGSGFGAGNAFDGRTHHYRINAETIAGRVWADLYVDGTLMANITSFSETEAGTAGQVQTVIVNPLEQPSGTANMPILGHIAVWASLPDTYDVVWASTGYLGETAGARLARLGNEQGVPIAIVGDAETSAPMGPQTVRSWYDLVLECVTTDGGLLDEQVETLGLTYRTRGSLYNQAALLEVDYTALAPGLTPDPDQFAVVNDVTVKGVTGEYRARLETGPLSALDPPDGIGEVAKDLPVNEAYPWQLRGIAGWARHLGTWDEARWPQVPVYLHGAPFRGDVELTSRAAALGPGRVLEIDGLPDNLPPGPVRLMVVGLAETIPTNADRKLAWVMEPADPYTVGIVGETTRLDTAGSLTVADFDAGVDTVLQVERAPGTVRPWITTANRPQDFDFTVVAAGVILNVTGITGAGDPQSMTVDQTPVNGITKTIPAGTPVRLAYPWRLAR